MVSSAPCRFAPDEREPKWASEPIWKPNVYVNWTETAADAVRGWLFERVNENLSSLIGLEMS